MLKFPSFSGKPKFSSIGVLTSGGDAPGMNAAIRAVVRYGSVQGCKVFGIQRGYSGLLEGKMEPMTPSSVANIIQRGGTILKTSRCPEFHQEETRKKASEVLRQRGVEALVVVGGDGSFRGAHLLENETGIPTIGVPGTIDNDIYGTDDTIGFDTAVNTALEAIDRIRDTANSHDRLFLVEVMGRNYGEIALHVGIAGGAETIVEPEHKKGVDEICKAIERGVRRGKTSSIIVVAEGEKSGLSHRLSEELQGRGYHPRVCILGHTQRGGTPTAHDRYLAALLGGAAVGKLLEGQSNYMVGVQQDETVCVPFEKIFHSKKRISKDLLKLAQILAT